jgi:hypothetical protein
MGIIPIKGKKMNLLNPSLLTRLLISAFLMVSPIKTISVGAAGILPYAWDKKTKTYSFLLGQEAYGEKTGVKCTWADFGGKMDPIDKGSFVHNAVREFCEESGVSKSKRHNLRHQIRKNPVIKHPRYNYFMYFAQIPYRPAGTFIGDGEKSACAWVPVNFLLQELGRKLNTTGRMPTDFIYDGTRYVLRKGFKECLQELLHEYNPNKEYYYFKHQNPKEVISRLLEIKTGHRN